MTATLLSLALLAGEFLPPSTLIPPIRLTTVTGRLVGITEVVILGPVLSVTSEGSVALPYRTNAQTAWYVADKEVPYSMWKASLALPLNEPVIIVLRPGALALAGSVKIQAGEPPTPPARTTHWRVVSVDKERGFPVLGVTKRADLKDPTLLYTDAYTSWYVNGKRVVGWKQFREAMDHRYVTWVDFAYRPHSYGEIEEVRMVYPQYNRAADGSILDLTADNWTAEVSKPGLLLAEFYATWCGACQQQRPILESAAGKIDGICRTGAVDSDRSRALLQQFGIRSIPQLILFKDGKEVYRFEAGVQTEADIMSAVLRYASQ